MRRIIIVTIMLCTSLWMQSVASQVRAAPADGVPRMTTEELKAKLGSPEIIIIDVRSAHDWQDSNVKIKGAVREDAYKLGSWISKYPKDRTLVLYCK